MDENIAIDLIKLAISENDLEKIRTILLEVEQEKVTPALWVGALHHACLSTNLKAIEILLNYIPALLNSGIQDKAHTLQFCAAHNCIKPAQQILSRAKEVTQLEKEKALEIALNSGFFDLSYLLLESGASLFHFNRRGETPFHVAVRFGARDFLSYLLREYAVVKNIPLYGNFGSDTPLLYVFKCHGEENIELASRLGQLLIESEVDINLTRWNGVGALHLSVVYNTPELYRALRQKGADDAKLDSTGKTALQLLIELRPMELELYLKNDPMLELTFSLSSFSEIVNTDNRHLREKWKYYSKP